MCATYSVKGFLAELEELLKSLVVVLPSPTPDFPERVLPHRPAPVLWAQGEEYHLDWMNYSLVPSWSKERRPKFATYNARWDGLDAKATWREPTASRRCLVPMRSFYEAVHQPSGPGQLLEFTPPTGGLLWAAGLWDEWVDRVNGEVVRSFAVITDESLPVVREAGHDRSPIFLEKEGALEWIRPGRRDPASAKVFLRAHRHVPELSVRKERDLKGGKPPPSVTPG